MSDQAVLLVVSALLYDFLYRQGVWVPSHLLILL